MASVAGRPERSLGTHELWWGFYVGLVGNLAAAAFLNNAAWDASAQVWFVTLGTVNELLGVLLVASPELLPRLRRVVSWMLVRWRGFTQRFLSLASRLLGLSRGRTVRASAAGSIGVGGKMRAAVLRRPAPAATTEERVDWLVEQSQRDQERLNEIEGRLADLPDEWRRDIAATREELEGLSRTLVRAVADARIRLRLLGVAYVIVGLVLSWLGNIV